MILEFMVNDVSKQSSQRVQRSIELLVARYEMGRDALSRIGGGRDKFARGIWVQLEADHGETRSNIEKARQFAELFTEEEFARLCMLRSPSGRAIGWGHITKILAVSNRSRRNSLLKKAAENGWSARKLDDEVRKKQPEKRSSGSPPMKLPQGEEDALLHLKRMCNQWLNWDRQMKRQGDDGFGVDDLPPEVKRQFAITLKHVTKLGEACGGG